MPICLVSPRDIIVDSLDFASERRGYWIAHPRGKSDADKDTVLISASEVSRCIAKILQSARWTSYKFYWVGEGE